MDKEIDRAIGILVGKITPPIRSDDAVKYTQAASNLSHVKEILRLETQARSKKGASA